MPTPETKPNLWDSKLAHIDWDVYRKGREPYPQRLFDIIFDYHAKGGAAWDNAIDFGSGDCTLAPAILQRFKHVEATDSVDGQLKIGQERLKGQGIGEDKLSIRACSGGNHPGKDGSADLITAATCVYFFDIPAFIADAARLLRPGGTLAIFIGGGLPLILDRDSEGKAKISDVGQCLIDFMNNSVMAEFNKDMPTVTNQFNLEHISLPPNLYVAETRYEFGTAAAHQRSWIKWYKFDDATRTAIGAGATVIREHPDEPREAISYRNDLTFADLDKFFASIGRQMKGGSGGQTVPWTESKEWGETRAKMVKLAGGEEVKLEAVYAITMLLGRKKA